MTIEITKQVVVFDSADIAAESAFWAGVLGGEVKVDDDWHSVSDSSGTFRIDVQLAPDHVRPQWPDGEAQQIHLDLYVTDIQAAHEHVTGLGAEVLEQADMAQKEGFQVYADPAGHPFCLCWG